MRKANYLFIFILLLSVSCKKTDLTPTWLIINEIKLTTNEPIEGVNSHDIIDAWVYLNNQPKGVWELPAEIPILEEGEFNILVYPGVVQNGTYGERITYPFYNQLSDVKVFKRGDTIVLDLTTSYESSVNFSGKENFEDTGSILNPDTEDDTTKMYNISKTNYPDIVKYGNNCGRIKLHTGDTVCRVLTDVSMNLPSGRIFMEFDYMNNNSFTVGIIAKTAFSTTILSPEYFVRAQDNNEMTWKKTYVDFSEYIGIQKANGSILFDFYFLAILDDENTEADIYIDNIKFVHY